MIFKQRLELQGETRQLLLTERKLPSYVEQVRESPGLKKPETNAVQLLLVGKYGAKFIVFE